ncbi:MAG: hypothetical protein ACREPA_05415 [Candidatus Dormibacteraceae bacterium]
MGRRADAPGDRYAIWLGLLAAGQAADVLTSGAGMSRGTLEANWVAAAILAAGGLGLLWILKMVVVIAVGASILMARAWARQHPGRRADMLLALVWRGTQLSVVSLVAISTNNLVQSLR